MSDKRMTFNLRIDSQNSEHVHFTLFANGASCGRLCMRVREYQRLCAVLLIGGRRHGHTDVGVTPPTMNMFDEEAA
jgi:hypothetical protein